MSCRIFISDVTIVVLVVPFDEQTSEIVVIIHDFEDHGISDRYMKCGRHLRLISFCIFYGDGLIGSMQ